MLYKIKEATEQTTQTGKTYKRAIIVSPEGFELNVSVWSDYPEYARVIANSSVEGVIRDTGKYKNLVSGNLGAKPAGMAKSAMMDKAMEKKASYIATAQDNKEQSIKVASTFRAAVDLAIAERQPTENPIQAAPLENRITYWRKWLWEHWDIDLTDFEAF